MTQPSESEKFVRRLRSNVPNASAPTSADYQPPTVRIDLHAAITGFACASMNTNSHQSSLSRMVWSDSTYSSVFSHVLKASRSVVIDLTTTPITSASSM